MIVGQHQAVSIHTRTGVQLYQYLPHKIADGNWSRISRDTSRCSLTLPPDDHLDDLDLYPWLHWASIWNMDAADDAALLWTGPIMSVTATRTNLQIEARDCSAFMSRTRVPMTKQWDATDVALIAVEFWQDMLELHGIPQEPIVKLDPDGSVFNYSSTADQQLMSDVMDELVNMGLRWTVVSGTPILGPAPKNAIESLGPEHFAGDGITLTRDGSSFYNDILLLSGDQKAHSRVPTAGLNLQTIFTRDNVFTASNTERAVNEAAKYYSKVRDAITLPGGSQLAPNAPLDIDQLIPSARVDVEAYGQIYRMSIEQVQVPMNGDNVSVSLEAVTDDLPELANVSSQLFGISSSGGVAGGSDR